MIYVFKTSVKTKKAIKELTPKLEHFILNSKWNFDLEYYDKILRIDSQFEIRETTIKLLQDNGYKCEELLD
jgi:PleD family two-component response regulator